MEQRIVCAAIKNDYGSIICGPRHWDMTMRKQLELSGERFPASSEQGFVDQHGNFLSRQEALKIAKANGQIIRRCGGDDTGLFSENLY